MVYGLLIIQLANYSIMSCVSGKVPDTHLGMAIVKDCLGTVRSEVV